MKLFCLPFAGAGATLFRAWPKPLDRSLQVVPLQLPGREERFADEFHQDIEAAGREQVGTIRSAIGPSERFALFGHSFGATLAFEVAHQFAERSDSRLFHLFASGAPAPDVPLGRDSTNLDDEAFVLRVEDIAGYRHPALADPEFRELVLPALRADVCMHESYRARDRHPLKIPITVFRGSEDTTVSEADSRRWSHWSMSAVRYCEMPGGHMYLMESPDILLQEIASSLRFPEKELFS
jgi:surfactin synthase thioesterase subunit